MFVLMLYMCIPVYIFNGLTFSHSHVLLTLSGSVTKTLCWLTSHLFAAHAELTDKVMGEHSRAFPLVLERANEKLMEVGNASLLPTLSI